MHSAKKLQVIGLHRPNLRLVENHPKSALYVRLWTRLLTALHESRKKEAAHVVRRHRDLIQNFKAIEFPGRGDALKTDARPSTRAVRHD